VAEKFWVYVIKNAASGKIYTGLTSNLKRRLAEHNTPRSGSRKFTHRQKGNWTLVHCEAFDDKSEASKRERFLKTGQGRQFLKISIAQRETKQKFKLN
jgi:putative endonuclease